MTNRYNLEPILDNIPWPGVRRVWIQSNTHLILENARLDLENIQPILIRMDQIKRISIYNSQLEDGVLAALLSPQVHKLKLSNSNCSTLLKVICENITLQQLELRSEQSVDGIFTAISTHPRLRKVVLKLPVVEDLKLLLTPTVTYLDLNNLNLTLNQLRPLLHALEPNTVLTHLDLSCNDLGGMEGARCIATVVERNTTLQRLAIRNSRLTEPGMARILDALTFNPSIQYLCAWLRTSPIQSTWLPIQQHPPVEDIPISNAEYIPPPIHINYLMPYSPSQKCPEFVTRLTILEKRNKHNHSQREVSLFYLLTSSEILDSSLILNFPS